MRRVCRTPDSRRFFNAIRLLHQGYHGKLPHPETVRFKFKIPSKEKGGIQVFDKDKETVLIRVLVQGMPENTLFNRFLDEQLEGGDFKDGQDIIWQYEKETAEENTTIFESTTSTYWFHDLKYAEGFEVILEEEEPVS